MNLYTSPTNGHVLDSNYEVISKNKPIGSSKSDNLKLNKSICTKCNTDSTSQYDDAWMVLCRYLLKQRLDTKDNLIIPLGKVFPYKRYMNSLFLHLYFVKNFGCRIIEDNVPIDTEELSQSLNNKKPCKSIFLLFKKWGKKSDHKHITTLPIEASQLDRIIFSAVTSYTIGNLTVEVIYSPKMFRDEFLDKTFHPIGPTNRILIFQNV